MMKSFIQVSSDRKQKCFYTHNSPVRILHTFAIAMQYTIQKVLFRDFANARHQSQLSEACLPQCIETERPISPESSLFCTGS